MLGEAALKLTSTVTDQKAAAIFCKGVTAFFLIKLLLARVVLEDIAAHHVFSKPSAFPGKLIYFGASWGVDNITFFTRITLLFLCWVIVVKSNYIMAAITAWLSFSFYLIAFPMANGADQIMISLLIFAIPLSAAPVIRHEIASTIQNGIYNASRLFCRLYVCSIYLISGLDKLESESWRAGDAIMYTGKLRYMVPPGLQGLFPEGETTTLMLSWCIILFELAFPVLVWFRISRMWVLLAGVIFHILIAVFLSLPDFALIMILSYLIFLRDEDYQGVIKLVSRKKDV
jgi:hypothetical protein